jgi:hypothetical protein
VLAYDAGQVTILALRLLILAYKGLQICFRDTLRKLHSFLIRFEQEYSGKGIDSKTTELQVGPMLDSIDALDGQLLGSCLSTQRLGALFTPMATRHVDPQESRLLDA